MDQEEKNKKSRKRTDYGYHDDWYGNPGWDDEDDIVDEFLNQDEVDDWDDWDEIESKNTKTYYDRGGELVAVEDVKVSTKHNDYEWIMSKFVGSKLTMNDLQVIKHQYLDLSNHNDKLFYDYLVEYVNEKNQ